ncbi:bifunctional nicotinamidase/pyrazinamidase [Pelagibacterium sp.]|uniref:bifunctional nicotinamidase/pyrazinamidase n=1 Tax=Pelagibacterium sp. TaxID=1967288 RepID=UPI003A8F766D
MAGKALIVIDVQNDFCPGGALAVDGGDGVVPIVNKLMGQFNHVILTQDWHTADHSSFASQHQGKVPFDDIEMPYGSQRLWPDHCIQGSHGADFHPELNVAPAELIIRKGFRTPIDSYSAFFENDHKTPTGLTGYLRERGLDDLTFVGLATDFCVAYSAIDAVGQGFSARVLLDACRGIDLMGSLETMIGEMKAKAVDVI